MPAQQNARDRLDRERRDEAERIAIRMGFHSAFVRAVAAQAVVRRRHRP
jgi:hypothetical protein